MICLNVQAASSIEHTIYGHVLGHKGGARAPSAPWLDPPLLHLCFHICKKGGSLMTQLMDPAGLKPINLCTAYQPQTSTLACRKIHYTIQPANN